MAASHPNTDINHAKNAVLHSPAVPASAQLFEIVDFRSRS